MKMIKYDGINLYTSRVYIDEVLNNKYLTGN